MCFYKNVQLKERSFLTTTFIFILLCLATIVKSQKDPLTTYHFEGNGWSTFGIVLPEGQAYGALKVGDQPTQTNVKTRWDDGSIRFAQVHTKIPSSGDYDITETDPDFGSYIFVPTFQNVTVSFTIIEEGVNKVYTARIPASMQMEPTHLGRYCSEFRAVVAPKDSRNRPHSYLRVIFDARGFEGGGNWYDLAVENTFDDRGDTVVYDVVIRIGSQVVYRADRYRHARFTRWRRTFSRNLRTATVTPDFESFYRAGAFPRYCPDIMNPEMGYDPDAFGPGQAGPCSSYMPGHGDRWEIGLIPTWAVTYLVHKTQRQREFTLGSGQTAASWGIHVLEPDYSLISLDVRPNYWLDGRSPAGEKPVGGWSPPTIDHPTADIWLTYDAGPDDETIYVSSPHPNGSESYLIKIGSEIAWVWRAEGTTLHVFRGLEFTEASEYSAGTTVTPLTPLQHDLAHHPDLAYVPYLLTGDRFYEDELAFWANYMLIGTYPAHGHWNERGGSQGIMACSGELRGYAWQMRTLVNAAAYLPDDHPSKSYFGEKVMNNLAWLDGYSMSAESTPIIRRLWVSRGYYRPDLQVTGGYAFQLMMTSIEHCVRQGFIGGLHHRDTLMEWYHVMCTQMPDPRDGFRGVYHVGESDGAGGIRWVDTVEEMYELNDRIDGWSYNFPQIAGYYGPNVRIWAISALMNGLEGAREVYDYVEPLVRERPHVQGVPDMLRRAQWAFDFPERFDHNSTLIYREFQQQ